MVSVHQKIATGISGLDIIFGGGYIQNSNCLVKGKPGTGKTTLGLHFLNAGTLQGEKCLLITLGERRSGIVANAALFGIDLSETAILDLSPQAEFFSSSQSYDIFTPSEVEREPVTAEIMKCVEELKPSRVFIDSVSNFRYLAGDEFQYRRQTIAFLRYLQENGATVLLTSESGSESQDSDLQFICDAVINLCSFDFYNTLKVEKYRGMNHLKGAHSFRITDSGITIFPKLRPSVHSREFIPALFPSGIESLDKLTGGGLNAGTVSIISGPAGVGKTTAGMQFLVQNAVSGGHSVHFSFEEETEIMIQRCEKIGIPVKSQAETGRLSLVKVEPLSHTPDEFALIVRNEVESRNASLVMIDSIAGYKIATGDSDLTPDLHALCKYLQNMGVATILIAEQETIAGEFRATDNGISYLADTLIFIKYIEIDGSIKKAIGVLKKRLGDFEKTLRELEITGGGIKVGAPFHNVKGILTGIPEWLNLKKE